MTNNYEDFLVDSERQLGAYTVVLLRQTSSGNWAADMQQMDAIVTNYRLMLRPHRKKFAPASLPSRYIKESEMTKKGFYHCVQLTLITNHILCLTLSTGHLENLCEDLNAMKAPPPKFHFDDKVARQDIERLISFFGKLPSSEQPDQP